MQRILIVEDERDMARGLEDILEYEGYEVVTVGTGAEGLREVQRAEPDCIILDLMLPDMSGHRVCEQIRRRGYRTPIIILSARSQEYDKIRGLQGGGMTI